MVKLRSLVLGLSALAVFAFAAHAVIDGNNTSSQRHRVHVGELVPGCGSATQSAASQAVTIDNGCGTVTLATNTLSAATVTSFTISNSRAQVGDRVLVTLDRGTQTNGIPVLVGATPATGSITVSFANAHASTALNGAMKVYFLLLRQGNDN